MEGSTALRQRPAWFYVLMGCGAAGGLVLLLCLGSFLGLAKCGYDAQQGVLDPETRKANAIKQLGAIPEGYSVAASIDVFLGQQTTLVDSDLLPDGGFQIGAGHLFVYRRVMAQAANQPIRDFLLGKEVEPGRLVGSGINPDPDSILKRGTLTVEGRTLHYITQRALLDLDPGLLTHVLFDCPGDALSVGTWAQLAPSPNLPKDELELAGTVADEAELARFFKSMNPCR